MFVFQIGCFKEIVASLAIIAIAPSMRSHPDDGYARGAGVIAVRLHRISNSRSGLKMGELCTAEVMVRPQNRLHLMRPK